MSSTATDDLKHAAGDVKHAAGKVEHNAEVAAHDAKEKAENVAEDAKEKSKAVAEDVKENAQWAAEKTKENASVAAENAQHNARAAADKIADVAARADPRELTPRSALDGLKNIDRTILRLNKLLAQPGGLSAFLSTFNYSLYILAYLQSKSLTLTNLATKILALVRPHCDDTKIPATTLINTAGIPPVAALAVLISKARTTLRLFGLFPLYAWIRTLLAGPKPGADVVLHRIALLQASSYATYQALENICLLADSGVISPTFIARINRNNPTTARLYLWAYRAWLGGVSCDFLRLGREWQIEAGRRATRKQMLADGRAIAEYQDEEDKKFDKRWWTDAMIAGAWLPMAVHFSDATGGIPGWNLGWMGLSGLVAGSTRVKALWASTA